MHFCKRIGILIFCCGLFATVQAQYSTAQIGIRFSNKDAIINNSITGRYFISDRSAVEGLISFGNPVAIGGLYEVFNPLPAVPGLSWFYGAGAYVGFSRVINSGAQGVAGLGYTFDNLPLDFSLDWKPELSIVRSVNFEPAAFGISVRFVIPKK